MSTSHPKSVAIIGAGLSGLALALALHQQKIRCTIYESRPAPLDIGGAIMLSPNALRVLDALGVYSRLSPLAYRFQTLHFRTQDDKPLDTFSFGSADEHGYDGMRVYRFELINILLAALSEAGIMSVYGSKFDRVISENEEGVTWLFADGSTGSASLLVGADGIHSRVRSHISTAVPVFANMIGVTAAVPASQLGPAPSMPLTIMHKVHGAFVAAPQRRDGSEILIGKQCRVAQEPDREGWARMTADKEWCVDFLREGSEDYPPLVRRAVSNIPLDSVNLWPFYVIPKLESWVSNEGRVVILGDAAHAIPPTAGQGVNQAFEDVHLFALVMGRLWEKGGADVRSTLRLWQQERQARVDGVLDLNAKLNKRRLPAQAGQQDEVEVEEFDLDWLYKVDFEAMVDDIMAEVVRI